MEILLLFVILPMIAILIIKLANITKLPVMILFIAIGLLFGRSGVINIFDSEFIREPLAWFTANIGLIILFLMAGFSMKINDIKTSGSLVIKQATLPFYLATFIGGTILYYIYQILNLDFGVTYPSILIYSLATALMSLPLAIPTLMQLKRATPNNVTPIIMSAGALENITLLPLTLVLLVFAQGSNSDTPILTLLGLVFLAAIIVIILGIILGKLYGKIMHKLEKTPVKYGIGFTIFVIIIVYISGPLKALGIIVALVAGMFLRAEMAAENIEPVAGVINKLFALLVLPSLFLGVGAQMDWHIFININVMLFIVISWLIIGIIKAFVSRFNFRGVTYGEEKIISTAVMLLGAGAINMSVLLKPFFTAIGTPGTSELMAYTGTVLYIICTLFSVYVLQNNQDKWSIEKINNNE